MALTRQSCKATNKWPAGHFFVALAYSKSAQSNKKSDISRLALRNDWRGLVDQFLNKTLEFDFPLERIKTTFVEVGIEAV